MANIKIKFERAFWSWEYSSYEILINDKRFVKGWIKPTYNEYKGDTTVIINKIKKMYYWLF